ncbi:MAG TPA: hypothetical protein VGP72_20225 [Planctomycetota bacterium]|jgi:hypothetical protein
MIKKELKEAIIAGFRERLATAGYKRAGPFVRPSKDGVWEDWVGLNMAIRRNLAHARELFRTDLDVDDLAQFRQPYRESVLLDGLDDALARTLVAAP